MKRIVFVACASFAIVLASMSTAGPAQKVASVQPEQVLTIEIAPQEVVHLPEIMSVPEVDLLPDTSASVPPWVAPLPRVRPASLEAPAITQVVALPVSAPKPPAQLQKPRIAALVAPHQVPWDQIKDPKQRVNRVKTKLTYTCGLYLTALNATGKHTEQVREFIMNASESQAVQMANSYCPGTADSLIQRRTD